MCLESLSSCFCASLLYLVCPLKKAQSFALLSLQLLSSTSTLALYTADTGTFGPLSDWPRIALGPLHAVFNNTTLFIPASSCRFDTNQLQPTMIAPCNSASLAQRVLIVCLARLSAVSGLKSVICPAPSNRFPHPRYP